MCELEFEPYRVLLDARLNKCDSVHFIFGSSYFNDNIVA